MIYLSFAIIVFAFYTVYAAEDVIDLAKASYRLLLACLLLVWCASEDLAALEGAVLISLVFQLSLSAILRMEVQVSHDRD